MNTTKLECKTYSFNVGLFVVLIILYFASFPMFFFVFDPGVILSDTQTDIFIFKVISCSFLSLLFPIFIPKVDIKCTITSEGIHLKNSFLCGLIRLSKSVPWSEVKSWDSSIFFNPMVPLQIPQIKLFLTKSLLRFDKTSKKLSYNNEPTDWEHFKRELESLFYAMGIPQKTPEPVQAQTRLLKKSFLITTIVLGILILFGCVLSVVVGKISYPLIYAGVVFSILFAGASTQIFKKK